MVLLSTRFFNTFMWTIFNSTISRDLWLSRFARVLNLGQWWIAQIEAMPSEFKVRLFALTSCDRSWLLLGHLCTRVKLEKTPKNDQIQREMLSDKVLAMEKLNWSSFSKWPAVLGQDLKFSKNSTYRVVPVLQSWGTFLNRKIRGTSTVAVMQKLDFLQC